MAPKITLYVDTVSPFAYIAYYILRNDPAFSKCEITYIPVFLGGIMKACGNTPPINIKNKDKWIAQERIRWAKIFNVPMNEKLPEDFPQLTLPNMRALCALTTITSSQKPLCDALDALFHAYWVEHRVTNKPDVLAEVLKEALGDDMTSKVLGMMGKEGKQVLAANTEKAVGDGAFGLPWFVCEIEGKKEGFWGVDHMGVLAQALGLEQPKMRGWKALL